MAVITIISDWHNNDYYISSLKGKLYSTLPTCNIVDISHTVTRYNSTQTAFIISSCYKFFPPKSIHLLCVASEASEQNPHVVIKYNNQYFIGTDNGQFGLICETNPEWILRVTPTISNAPEIDIFASIAAKIYTGTAITEMGTYVKTINQRMPLLPTLEDSIINGSIVYIDSYRNAITNISADNFKTIGKNRRFEILVQSNHYKITEISQQYNHAPEGELLALFNSLNLLEIAIRNGFAADMLNLKLNAVVRVRFYNNVENIPLKLF